MIELKNKEDRYLIKSALFVLLLLLLLTIKIFIDSNDDVSKEEAYKAKLKMFMDGETLLCSVSPLKYSVKYQVSKQRGWSIQGQSVTKGDMLIDINECHNSTLTTKGE
jgi:hypothetical protein